MESLTPEVRAMCALLKADTTEDFDRRFTEYQATVKKAVRTLVDEARFGEPAATPSSTAPSLTTSEVSTVLRVPTVLDVVPIAADVNVSNLAAPTPTTCSTGCLSSDDPASVCTIIPSATPNSTTAIGGVVPELAAPEVSNFVPAATTYMTTGGSVSEHCCSEPETAAASSTRTPAPDLSQACSIKTNSLTSGAIFTTSSPATVSAVGDLLKRGDTLTLQPPWPPPAYVIRTLESEWNAILTVIIFALGVQCTQLQPTTFKRTGKIFHDTQLLDLLMARRAICTLSTWCYIGNLYSSPGSTTLAIPEWKVLSSSVETWVLVNSGSLGSTNWALGEEQGQVLMSMPWPPFRCCSVASYPILFWKLPTGHPHENPDGYDGSFVLHWTSFTDGNQWESGNMGSITSMKENVPAQLLEVYNMLCRLTSNQFPADLFVIEHWLIPWELGGDSPGHNLMESFISLAITCELLYSISVGDNLLADRYWLWFRRCVELDTDEPRQCVLYFRPKPPWSDFAPTISSSEFRSNMTTVSTSLHIISIPFELNLLGVPAWYRFSARFRPPAAYVLLVDMKCVNNKNMSSWNYPLPSADHVQLSSHCFLCMVRYPDGIMDITLIIMMSGYPTRNLIQGLLHPLGKIIDGFQGALLGGYIMVGCFRSARNNELTQGHAADGFGALFRANETLLLPWDPGDYSASAWRQSNPGRVDDTCYCPGIDTSQVPWDPGDSSRDRLGGKPKFKGGGLSATRLLWSWAGNLPRLLGLSPLGSYMAQPLQIQQERPRTRHGRTDRMASALGARIG